ncbi:UDP-glucuronosyltransferase 1-7C-like [Asbolus verrucosus]|uniref:UDP-glucuronosyltransferase 1-7C-like n=1 Tax=Asbolus verrucosus TaxID=1661398 RepID=A0A482VP03_ASBVE|nr:UDP-glucuronosyltransferase 1-7C-like [Asbolus verrucosus]
MCLKVFVLLNLFFVVYSYKILGLFPHPGKSHVDVFLSLTKALAKKGHEITVVSHFPLKTPLPNYTDVRLGDASSPLVDILTLDNFQGKRFEKWFTISVLNDFAQHSCRMGFKSPAFQEFIRKNHTFDVIIAELFNSDCFLGLVHKFKAPLIGISSSTIMPWTSERFGNPTHPAYIPVNIMDYSDRMTFFERMENLIVGFLYDLLFNGFMRKKNEMIAREYLGEDLPPLKDVIYNTSLFLINTHFSLNFPRPLVPAIVEVGGIHLHQPQKLPRIMLEDPSSHLVGVINMDSWQGQRTEKWFIIQLLDYFAQTSCKANFESPALRDFLKTDHTFDVIIAEFFNSDCLLGIVHKFKAPLIGISSCTIMHWTNERFGNPTNPAYIPNNIMDYTDQLSFFERVENLLVGLAHQIFYTEVMARNDEKIARQYFGESLPPLKNIFYNSSLLLVNTHFSLNLPRPLVPAVIEVGGIHIDNVNKLPEDLEKWISGSPHGVIYFSLGSMIKGHTFPEEKRREFLKAFGRLPQRVLWKWENDSMQGKPDNVMIQKWMPQLDILLRAH